MSLPGPQTAENPTVEKDKPIVLAYEHHRERLRASDSDSPSQRRKEPIDLLLAKHKLPVQDELHPSELLRRSSSGKIKK